MSRLSGWAVVRLCVDATTGHRTPDHRTTGQPDQPISTMRGDGPRPLRPFSDRLPARRRRPHGALQLALRAASGGMFVLRIEDTDVERSSWDMVTGILDGMRWLGWTGTKGRTSAGRTRRTFSRSGSTGIAPWRDGWSPRATPTTATARRRRCSRSARRRKPPAAVDIRPHVCLALTDAERAAREATGAPARSASWCRRARRRFDDLVHGPIEFDNAQHRGLRHPALRWPADVSPLGGGGRRGRWRSRTWCAATITSRTRRSRCCCIRRSARRAAFAHVPLILGPDKKRLSKRHGATSVMEYERQGYLPEAMVNFLALLGWSPGSDEEVFTRDELVERFTLEGISGGNAVFNPEKLDWFNQQHLMRLPTEEVARRLRAVLEAAGLWRDDVMATTERAWLERVIDLLKPRVEAVAQFVDEVAGSSPRRSTFDAAAVNKHLVPAGMHRAPRRVTRALRKAQPFTPATSRPALRGVAEARGIKAAALIHATRVAVTGRAASPGLFEVLELVGRHATTRASISRLLRKRVRT